MQTQPEGMVPMQQYPIPLHTLMANQYSLMSAIGPAAAQTWRYGRGKMFTSDFCFMLQDIGAFDPNYFEAGMPWVASYMALEANKVNEARGYGHPAHEVHRIRVGPLWAGREAVEQTRNLGKIWDARGAEYYDTHPAPIGLEFYGRRDLHHLVVRTCLEYLRDHGERAQRFMNQEWIIHFQARTDVPVEDLKVGTEKFHLIDFLIANIRLIARQLTATTEILATWHRTNPDGHKVKEMRDGEFSLFDVPRNRLVNFRDPVGTVELAAGDYTALIMSADYFDDLGELQEETGEWREIASELRRNTLRRFWVPSQNGTNGFFGMAIQRDPESPRSGWQVVETRGSGPFEAMDGEFLIGLPDEEYRHYLRSIVEDSRGDNFLTLAGNRMVAAEHVDAFSYDDYQWSTAVWTVTAGRIAAGYQRHGMRRLARDARRRPTNAAAIGGVVREFYIVPIGEDPFYLYRDLADYNERSRPGVVRIAPNDPEGGQGFSNSVVLCGALTEYYPLKHLMPTPTAFQNHLEAESLDHSPEVELISASEAAIVREAVPICYVDMEEAKNRIAELRRQYDPLINPIRGARN